jgi:methyl-accepting chemotaxis protein
MFMNLFHKLTRSKPIWRPAWESCLQASSGTLKNIAANTEKEFLQLGQRMQDFYERAKNMSRLSSQVATHLSGDDMNKEMESLRAIFDMANSQTERSAQGAVTLEFMLDKLTVIEERLCGFDKTVKHLQVLCNFIKIESARLGQSNSRFDTLGDDVRKLSVTIASKSLDLLGRSASLSLMIRQYLKTIADYEARQKGQSRLILDSAANNLSAMTEEYELAAETLKTIAVRWESISRNIGEIVASMQFHDITRQRLEHIRDALVELNTRGRNETENSDAPERKHPGFALSGRNGGRHKGDLQKVSLAMSLCELQKAQLVHADDDLVSAVGRMNKSLQKIADNVINTSEEIQKTAKASGGDGQSFLQKLEADLLSLAGAIATYGTLERDLSASMRTVTGAVGQMTSFIRDIQRIGIDLHMIALNASVQSAHIGQSGATLGVLAESIHRLSADTAQNIGEISSDLSAVVEEARSSSLQNRDDAGAGDAGFTGGIDSRIAAALGSIRLMNDDVTALLSRIDREGNDLSRDIEATVNGAAVNEGMSQRIREVVSELTELIAGMRSALPATAGQADSEELRDLAGRYTMEQERRIHQAMASSAAVALIASESVPASSEEGRSADSPPPSEQSVAPGESDEDLGDNVDLF